MAAAVSSFSRSQSTVSASKPPILKNVEEELAESDLSSFPSKHQTPISRTESAERSQSLSGEGTPERRKMATVPSEPELIQQKSGTKSLQSIQSSKIMSRKTKATLMQENSSSRSIATADYNTSFASLIKEFESINDSQQRTNSQQRLDLEVIQEDLEIASSYPVSTRA